MEKIARYSLVGNRSHLEKDEKGHWVWYLDIANRMSALEIENSLLKAHNADDNSLYSDLALDLAAMRVENEVLKRDLEEANEERQDRLESLGVECACGHDKPSDVCLGHLPWHQKMVKRLSGLESEQEQSMTALKDLIEHVSCLVENPGLPIIQRGAWIEKLESLIQRGKAVTDAKSS